jgi:uncharacterized protein
MESLLRPLVRQKIIDSVATPLPALTRREVWLPKVGEQKATAVIGMRRAGKTSLLWQILGDKLAQGAARESLLYFSFEDERLAGMTLADLDLLVTEYFKLYPGTRDRQHTTFFLDEIQIVPGWESFVRRLLDSENIGIYLSGSSARMLSREVATSMRGRAMEAVVSPFSFREFLRHQGQEPDRAGSRLTKADQSRLDHLLLVYLAEGGFPEAQGVDLRNRNELLKGYVDVVLLRDVIERHAVSHPIALRWMVRQLLGNAAGSFSISKFFADLKSQGIAVAKDTLHNYLAHLEDAFLVRCVEIASASDQRRRVNPRKVYPVDTGLIPVFDRSGKANLGHALECAVLHQLDRLGAEVSYVRTAAGHEVDFWTRHPDGSEFLIQVCANIDEASTLQREVRALTEAASEYPLATRVLIALDLPVKLQLPPGIRLLA